MDAASTPPTFPFHIARAYGASATAPSPARTPISTIIAEGLTIRPSGDSVQLTTRPNVDRAQVDRLVAARVNQRAEFAPSTAGTTPGALPMYRHPADRNAAATNIRAGSLVDVEG